MRNLFLACLLLLGTCVLAQSNARISNSRVTYDKTSLPAMRMDIDANPEVVADWLEEFWDERYEVDLDRTDRDKMSTAYLAEQVNLPLVSTKAFDLYTKVEGSADKSIVSMSVAFSENDVATRDVHPDSYRAAELMMQEFRTYFYTQYFDEQLGDLREELDDIRDDSQDASQDAEKARKKIAKYEDKIAKYQERIEDLRNEVGDELETADEKAARAADLERRVRELESRRARYLR